MSLSTLVKTNLIVSTRETANAAVSYILQSLFSLMFVGLILLPVFVKDRSVLVTVSITFILLLSFYDYLFVQAKLKGTSLVDNSALSLFPISRTRSLSTRFLLFLADKRILFYLLPMVGMMVVFGARNKFLEMIPIFLLFVSVYLAMSEVFLLIYFLLRKLANRFSVRTATQIAMIPVVLFAVLANAPHHKTAMLVMVPIISQFTTGYQAILTSHVETGLMEAAYLFGVFVSIALAVFGASFLYEKAGDRVRFKLASPTYKPTQKKAGPQMRNTPEIYQTPDHARKHDSVINGVYAEEPTSTAVRPGWHIVLVDWLIHQREEKILYLILLYPVMIIFSIIKITSHIHFDQGSLIFPIFFLTQILGFYFTEHHFTGHGLRLSHIALAPFDPYKFVFAKTVSTWGLLSLMNVFVCLFCGVYLEMSLNVLLQGTFFSLLLPMVLLQLANTIDLYFTRVSKHPLISLFIIIISELVLTAIYILIAMFSLTLTIIFVASILYMSLAFSLPAWGRQLSRQLPILLEVHK